MGKLEFGSENQNVNWVWVRFQKIDTSQVICMSELQGLMPSLRRVCVDFSFGGIGGLSKVFQEHNYETM